MLYWWVLMIYLRDNESIVVVGGYINLDMFPLYYNYDIISSWANYHYIYILILLLFIYTYIYISAQISPPKNETVCFYFEDKKSIVMAAYSWSLNNYGDMFGMLSSFHIQ